MLNARNPKMRLMLYGIWSVWRRGVSDTIFMDSIKPVRDPMRLRHGPKGNLNRFVSPSQQIELLGILRDKYKCLDFTVEPLFKTPEDLVRVAFWEKEISEYTKDEFLKKVTELSAQKKYKITINDNFFEVFNEFCSLEHNETTVRLELDDVTAPKPTLYANDLVIHTFQDSDNYLYKLMNFALKAENGKRISQSDILGKSKRNRGCSQDLSDIFKSPTVKDVFAREITKESFVIYHTITKADLKNVSSFQKSKPKGAQDTKYLLDLIKESRVDPSK